jgi:hypothetical protein
LVRGSAATANRRRRLDPVQVARYR